MSRIRFGEIRLSEKTKQLVNQVLESNQITAGPICKAFEELFAQQVQSRYFAFMSSGTSAVTAACMAAYDFGAKPGDYFLCPALSFSASLSGIFSAGFVPLPVDVGYDMNIDIEKLKEKIETYKGCRIAGILSVGLMGKPPKLTEIWKICWDNKWLHVYDACESYSSSMNGVLSNKLADITCCSFYTAHLINVGEGGGCLTDNTQIYEILKSIRSHGRQPDSVYFDHVRLGANFKQTDVAAALGMESCRNFWEIHDVRRRKWIRITESLSKYADKAWISTEEKGIETTPHGVAISFKDPNKVAGLKEALDLNEIDWKINFRCLPTEQPCFKFLGYQHGEFPVAELLGQGVHIGCNYWWTDYEVSKIIDVISDYMESI